MKEVLNLQKHLMRFTIDWYKTHQTHATTLELYGEHFNEDLGMSNTKNSAPKRLKYSSLDYNKHDNIPHHIAQNSSSDEIFLDDDAEDSFSSLVPESAKISKEEEIITKKNPYA